VSEIHSDVNMTSVSLGCTTVVKLVNCYYFKAGPIYGSLPACILIRKV